jgi:hypothetical protein
MATPHDRVSFPIAEAATGIDDGGATIDPHGVW